MVFSLCREYRHRKGRSGDTCRLILVLLERIAQLFSTDRSRPAAAAPGRFHFCRSFIAILAAVASLGQVQIQDDIPVARNLAATQHQAFRREPDRPWKHPRIGQVIQWMAQVNNEWVLPAIGASASTPQDPAATSRTCLRNACCFHTRYPSNPITASNSKAPAKWPTQESTPG